MTLYVESDDSKQDDKKKKEDDTNIPELTVSQEVKKQEIEPKQSFTEPPARYTEASLVKALEEKEIGRPSTYAPTITTIIDRKYIERHKKVLEPTELGRIVNSVMKDYFKDIVDVEFTAQMEEHLDGVAEGNVEWKKIISEFYGPFAENLEVVEKEMEKIVIKDEVTDIPCDKCGRMMVIKIGKYGKFMACPGFPECRNIMPIVEKLNIPGPDCGGDILIKKSKRGKRYYICANNDNTENSPCTFIAWNGPNKDGVIKRAELNKEEKAEVSGKKKKATTKKTTAKKTSKTKTTSKKTTKK